MASSRITVKLDPEQMAHIEKTYLETLIKLRAEIERLHRLIVEYIGPLDPHGDECILCHEMIVGRGKPHDDPSLHREDCEYIVSVKYIKELEGRE